MARTGSESPATETEAPATAAPESGTVKYTGSSGVREITKEQWKGAGVENQDTTVWDEGNEYTLPLNLFTADALEVLKRDKAIKVSKS